MRVATIVVSALVALFFATSLTLTFFAKEYLTGLALDFVTARTQRFAEPAVVGAEQALRAPGIKHVFDDEAIQTARQQLADYRRDPRGYIAQLVAAERLAIPPGQVAPLKEHVLGWKIWIRGHFERTFERLIWDVRIFSGTNLVAALLAVWFA